MLSQIFVEGWWSWKGSYVSGTVDFQDNECISQLKVLAHVSPHLDKMHVSCILYNLHTFNFPAGSLPNLGVSHHPKVNGNRGTCKQGTMQGSTF